MDDAKERRSNFYSSADHHFVKAVAWEPERGAERVNDFILMSRGITNSYVITSDAGDVMINTGAPDEGQRTRERFESLLGRSLNVSHIVFTQHHFDHIGGWENFDGPGVETIAQRNLPVLLKERAMLAPFFAARGRRILHGLNAHSPVPAGKSAFRRNAREPENPVLFDDDFAFAVGQRRFDLFGVPSGETLDSVMAWLPEEKVLFTGNWMGAIYGALPNFYTLRGDRLRSVPRFIRDLERLIALSPELMITGHDEPIVGADRIRTDMTRLLDAVRFIHDETVKGMNAQVSLSAMMQDIQLPAQLDMQPGRGPVSWYVRAVYEEYAGWFHHDVTTELYAQPASTIADELVEAVGGPQVLIDLARKRLAENEPVQAMHFLEIVLGADPESPKVREAEIDVLERLIERSEGRTFDELGWLEYRIEQAEAVISAASMTTAGD